MDRCLRHQGERERPAFQGPEERQPDRSLQGHLPERPAAVGCPELPAVRHRQRGHHRRADLPVQVHPRQPGRILPHRRDRTGRRLGYGSAVPDPEQAHSAPLPVHRWHDLHDRRLCDARHLLRQHHHGVRGSGAFLRAGYPHSDDRHPVADRLHRIRPAEERQAQRGRHPVRPPDARQDRWRHVQRHRRHHRRGRWHDRQCDRSRHDRIQHPHLQDLRLLHSARAHHPEPDRVSVQGEDH